MSALPDWRVFLFTAAMGFVAAFFFGLLPTLRMVRRKKNRSLWHQFVVCAQVGASCVLLILAGLLVRATLHTLYSDPGFGYEQVLSIDPGLSDHGYTPPPRKRISISCRTACGECLALSPSPSPWFLRS